MLDIDFIRRHADAVRRAIADKDIELDLDELLEVDKVRRETIAEIDGLRHARRELSTSPLARQRPPDPDFVAKAQSINEQIKSTDEGLAKVMDRYTALMLLVPSIPHPMVPVGHSEEENVEIRRWGEPRKAEFELRDHVSLAVSLGLVDFEKTRKFAGSRSYSLTGEGVMLERAALSFALDTVVERGFTAVSPPVMVTEAAMIGTGFFPIGRPDAYRLDRDDLYLVGTSEVSLVSLHADSSLGEDDLPIRYAGISACFRREAGAASRDTRGLYRVHQFHKVEQVVLCPPDPEVSWAEHERLLANSEIVLQGLELPYRVALACTGEIGQGQVIKHEVETWMPSRGKYSETHSCSSLYDFQARRSQIRYSGKGKGFVFTLNNTAIASPRILIPILENYQNADGSVTIPQALRPYMGGRTTLSPR